MSQDPQTDNANRAAEADDKDASAAADGQPIRRLERDGVDFTLIGTAHVSRASADAVRELAASGKFDAIAVELCQARYEALTAERKWTDLDLYRILREGKAGLVMANLALSAYQRRIAEQMVDAQKLGERSRIGVDLLGGEDGIVRVWDLRSGDQVVQIDLEAQPSAISLAAGGEVLGAGVGGGAVTVRVSGPRVCWR